MLIALSEKIDGALLRAPLNYVVNYVLVKKIRLLLLFRKFLHVFDCISALMNGRHEILMSLIANNDREFPVEKQLKFNGSTIHSLYERKKPPPHPPPKI